MATYKGEEIDLKPTETMAEEAQRGLDWREEYGRGGTRVGVARANQIVNRQELSPETVRRMVSFFARHEVDKEAEGFSPGEDGYPSAGRIAWAFWAGDPGKAWAEEKDRIMDRIDENETRALEDDFPEATLTGLQNKVDEHNEEHGDTQSKRVTSLGFEDLDLDGSADLFANTKMGIAQTQSQGVLFVLNDLSRPKEPSFFELGSAWGLASADFDGDADPDLLFASPVGAILLENLTAMVCHGDTNSDGAVDGSDLVNVLMTLGQQDGTGDVNGDGSVNVEDLIDLILAWGPCE